MSTASMDAVREDFERILAAADLPSGLIALSREPQASSEDSAEIIPREGGFSVIVRAKDEEWSGAAYAGLRELGFLFPHPRIQLSPSLEQLKLSEKKIVLWRPRLKRRGFHLHTQHPGEWTAGFFESRGSSAEDIIRWSARNGQNLLQLVALRTVKDISLRLSSHFSLARSLGVSPGLCVSLASIQQKSLRLIDWPLPLLPLAAFFPERAALRACKRAAELAESIPFDYLVLELGSSEFTPTPRSATLSWIEGVRGELAKRGRETFVKIHCSSDQLDPEVGNYNFLPALSDPRVGVLPHTVMFYGLEGPAPVYGRSDFADMRIFMKEQARRRPTWYFPETSYFLGIDIDQPLLLTDYLTGRARDMEILEEDGVDSQVVFTTGQELGYWLMDWTVALLAAGAPGGAFAGLDLLGESRAAWEPILAHQSIHFRDQGLLSAASSANLMDELPFLSSSHRVLARRILRELENEPSTLACEIARLEAAVRELPDLSTVKNEELRLMLDVTYERLKHCLQLRRAVAAPDEVLRAKALDSASVIRKSALEKTALLASRFSRYPEAGVFEKERNPTSYSYGYGWPALVLHFWEREEELVRGRIRNPMHRSLYRPLDILF